MSDVDDQKIKQGTKRTYSEEKEKESRARKKARSEDPRFDVDEDELYKTWTNRRTLYREMVKHLDTDLQHRVGTGESIPSFIVMQFIHPAKSQFCRLCLSEPSSYGAVCTGHGSERIKTLHNALHASSHKPAVPDSKGSVSNIKNPSGIKECALTDVEADQCTVCVTNKKNVLGLPCAHSSLCLDCVPKIKSNRCPICNNRVDEWLVFAT